MLGILSQIHLVIRIRKIIQIEGILQSYYENKMSTHCPTYTM